MNNSIALDMPIELINITPYNPLISKCQIKVCWVGEEPNRNKSIITKEVATELANSLPGSPIVGYYNEATEDFEEHNKILEISNGKVTLKSTTQAYGFIDLGAKVWFQKFSDDGVEHEYLVTEGWLWTEAFPECQRVVDQGNNQSMELSDKFLDAHWSKDANGNNQFFIINEAIISKLCILGEDVEPCFEGAQITSPKVEFSFEDDFKEQLFSMMKEIKNILEGGASMFTTYAVEIGDSLWSALYEYLEETYPDGDCYCSIYRIEGIYEEGEQKFAIIQNRNDMKYYRVNFSLTEEGLSVEAALEEVTKTYVPAETAQFAAEEVEKYEQEYAEKKKAAEKPEKDDEEVCPECGKPISECECEGEDNKNTYNLEEIPEYIELRKEYSELEEKYNTLVSENETVIAEKNELAEFKASIVRKEKEAMIESFYMLSDEDKEDVQANIDTYSLDDIEAKLSVICVRNKVSFENLDDRSNNDVTTYNLNNNNSGSEVIPAWIQAIQNNVAKNN